MNRITAVLLISISCLSACDKGRKNADGKKGAGSFEVTQVSGTVTSEREDAIWSFVTVRQAQFTVCLQDTARQGMLQNLEFSVRGRDFDSMSRRTDNRGCLSWNEQFAFDPSLQPTYITLNRSLVSMNQKVAGSIPVRLAVNLWNGVNGSEEAIINLDLNPGVLKISKADRISVRGAANPAEIEIDDVSADIQELGQIPGKPAQGKIQLRFRPKLKLKNMSGEDIAPVAIMRGRLKVKLLYTNAAGQRIHKDIPLRDGIISNGEVHIPDIPIEILQIDQQSSFKVKLTASAEGSPFPIETFEQEFPIANFTALLSGNYRSPKPPSSPTSAPPPAAPVDRGLELIQIQGNVTAGNAGASFANTMRLNLRPRSSPVLLDCR